MRYAGPRAQAIAAGFRSDAFSYLLFLRLVPIFPFWLVNLATAVVGPFGFLALEAGWGVTELGRQPWVIYGFLRTADAVTPMRGLVVPFTAFVVVYLFLSAAVIVLLRDQFRETTT